MQINLSTKRHILDQGRTQDLKKGGAAREARENLGSHPKKGCEKGGCEAVLRGVRTQICRSSK